MATKYVDFSAANNGDGSSYVQANGSGNIGAFNTLNNLTFSDGDIFWLRRQNMTANMTTNITITAGNVSLLGWPLSEDNQYSNRPSGAQASWDGDANTHPKISWDTSNLLAALRISGTNFKGHRLKLQRNHTVHSVMLASDSGGTFAEFRYLDIRNDTEPNTNGSAVDLITIGGTDSKIIDCYAKLGIMTSSSTSRIFTISNSRALVSNLSIEATRISGCGTVGLGTGAFNVNAASCNVDGLFIYMNSTTYTTNNIILITGDYGKFANLQVSSSSINGTFQCTLSNSVRNTEVEFNKIQGANGKGGSVAVVGGTSNFGNTIICNGLSLDAALFNLSSSIGGGNTFIVRDSVSSASGGYTTGASGGSNNGGNKFLFHNCTKGGAVWIGSSQFGEGSTVRSYNINGGFETYFSASSNYPSLITSNTVRTGGEAYSYKITVPTTPVLSVDGMRLFKLSSYDTELYWVTLPSTTVTITLYGAYKNSYAVPPDGRHISLECEYVDSLGSRKVARSSQILSSDSSTWTGDSGLTSFKVTVTVPNTVADLVVPIRLILGGPVDGSGYYYIDPKIIVS